MMRVLLLAPQPFLADRGTPIAIHAAVEALTADGHRIDLLTYFKGRDLALRNLRIHRIPRPPLVRRIPIGLSWQKIACDLFLWRKAVRLLKADTYDLVHAVEESVLIAWWLRRRFGVPYVFDMDSNMSQQIRDTKKWLRPFAYVFGRLERVAIRDSIGVLAVCPALVEHARQQHPGAHVALLPDMPLTRRPSRPATVQGAAAIEEIPGLRLLYVGNLEPYQGIDLLLEGVRLIADAVPDLTLVIVGGSEEHIEQYRRSADGLARGGRVRFLGPRPLSHLGALLSAADILASPRRTGINTPMKIYSYMASGRPIIATRLSTHTQVLDDSVALLVDPSPEAMADGLRRLAGDPDLRRRLGAAARDLVEKEYSPARFRERICGFYRTLPVAHRDGGRQDP